MKYRAVTMNLLLLGIICVSLLATVLLMRGLLHKALGVQAILRPKTLTNQAQEPSSTPQPRLAVGGSESAETAIAQCGSRWSDLAREVRERCSIIKETVMALQETARVATAVALPPKTLVPHTPNPADHGIVVTPGVIPDKAMKIEPIPALDLAEGPTVLRNATSVWRLGAVLDAQGDYHRMVLWAGPAGTKGHSKLGTFFDDAPVAVRKQWEHVWECPQDIGDITITGVTSQTGIVSFTSSSGKKGTFDLKTYTWAF